MISRILGITLKFDDLSVDQMGVQATEVLAKVTSGPDPCRLRFPKQVVGEIRHGRYICLEGFRPKVPMSR